MSIEVVDVVKVVKRNVWIEKCFSGSQFVMMQHGDGKSEPFCYCQFNYGYGYTDNYSINQAAKNMAKSLGASEPVEIKHREFNL